MDPEQGTEKRPNQQQEQAGKEPAHHLGINMAGTALPVGINAQTAQHPGNGRQDQHQIRKAEIPALNLITCIVELRNTRLGGER